MYEFLLFIALVCPLAVLEIVSRYMERGLSTLDPESQVTRKYRLSLIASACAITQIFAATAFISYFGDRMPWFESILENLLEAMQEFSRQTTPWLVTMLFTATLMILLGLNYVLFALPSLRLDRIIRKNHGAAQKQTRLSLRATLTSFLPMLAWTGTYIALPADFMESPTHFALLLAGFMFIVYSIAPLQIALAYPSELMPENHPVARTALDLCRQAGIRISGVRLLRFGEARVANALVSGLLPFFRRIYISDHMLETFSIDEVRAVLAHEVGHVRYRHLYAYLAFSLSLCLLLWLFTPILTSFLGDDWSVIATMVLIISYWSIVFPFASRIFERQADRYALEATGNLPTFQRALEKLAEVNGEVKNWAKWDIFKTHPSIAERIKALQA